MAEADRKDRGKPVSSEKSYNPEKEILELYRKSIASKEREKEGTNFNQSLHHSFVIFGASGDLASKKLYPTLWWLYRDQLLPEKTVFVGYARSELTKEDVRRNCEPHTKVKSPESERYEQFWKVNQYICGKYDESADIKKLNNSLKEFEKHEAANRIFYLAVPPVVFGPISSLLREHCMSQNGWTRVVVEKPSGHDYKSSKNLVSHMESLFTEDQVYRIDHYLGKEMVQNLMSIRFGNKIFEPAWDKNSIANVRITFKETIGIEKRGEYFDSYGIIRDVMQNHLIQIMTLVAMERPASCLAEDLRDAKVKVLKETRPIVLKDVVLGQYVGNPEGVGMAKVGYKDSPKVPKDSIQSTFAMAVLHIDNERWAGVPFILTSAKAVDRKKAEIRIQFKDVPQDIFGKGPIRNELVIKVQPDEAVYIKLMIKTPGAGFHIEESELELTYSRRYRDVKLPDAYERLLLDVFCGSQMHFVRADEMLEAWKIFTPLLQQINCERVEPIPYVFGSRGPEESDKLLRENDFVFTGTYKWKSS